MTCFENYLSAKFDVRKPSVLIKDRYVSSSGYLKSSFWKFIFWKSSIFENPYFECEVFWNFGFWKSSFLKIRFMKFVKVCSQFWQNSLNFQNTSNCRGNFNKFRIRIVKKSTFKIRISLKIWVSNPNFQQNLTFKIRSFNKTGR